MTNITHAAVTHKLDGVEYEFSPLDLEDMEALELYLKSRAISAGRESIPDTASDDDRDLMMATIIEVANKINIFTEDGYSQLLTPGGVARMLCKMLNHRHSDITLEQCSTWLSSQKTMQELLPKIRLFSTSRSSESNGSVAALKRGSRRGKKRPTTGRRSSAR